MLRTGSLTFRDGDFPALCTQAVLRVLEGARVQSGLLGRHCSHDQRPPTSHASAVLRHRCAISVPSIAWSQNGGVARQVFNQVRKAPVPFSHRADEGQSVSFVQIPFVDLPHTAFRRARRRLFGDACTAFGFLCCQDVAVGKSAMQENCNNMAAESQALVRLTQRRDR